MVVPCLKRDDLLESTQMEYMYLLWNHHHQSEKQQFLHAFKKSTTAKKLSVHAFSHRIQVECTHILMRNIYQHKESEIQFVNILFKV